MYAAFHGPLGMCVFELFYYPSRMGENSSPEIYFMQHPAPRTNVMAISEIILCLKLVPKVKLFFLLGWVWVWD